MHKRRSVNWLLVFGGRPYLHSSNLTEIQKLHCGKKNGLVCKETSSAEHTTTDGDLKIPKSESVAALEATFKECALHKIMGGAWA